jgi:hypothetical protein
MVDASQSYAPADGLKGLSPAPRRGAADGFFLPRLKESGRCAAAWRRRFVKIAFATRKNLLTIFFRVRTVGV